MLVDEFQKSPEAILALDTMKMYLKQLIEVNPKVSANDLIEQFEELLVNNNLDLYQNQILINNYHYHKAEEELSEIIDKKRKTSTSYEIDLDEL